MAEPDPAPGVVLGDVPGVVPPFFSGDANVVTPFFTVDVPDDPSFEVGRFFAWLGDAGGTVSVGVAGVLGAPLGVATFVGALGACGAGCSRLRSGEVPSGAVPAFAGEAAGA